MKFDILTALIKRFNKSDKTIEALNQTFTSLDDKYFALNSYIEKFSTEVVKDRESKKQTDKALTALSCNVKSLNLNQKKILLQEQKEPQKGDNGLSAYQLWLKNGNKGTQSDFFESLEGEGGEDGRGIKKLFINASKHWIVIYTDDTRVDLGKIVTETFHHGSGVTFSTVVGLIAFADYRFIDKDETVFPGNRFIEVTVTGVTVTLLTAVGRKGRRYSIDNSSGGAITLISAEPMNGLLSRTILSNSRLSVISNGINWRLT